VNELLAFFLKYLLWIPPLNPLNSYRLILWFFLAAPAIREYYEFISNPNCKRIGDAAWIGLLGLILELLLCLKYGKGKFYLNVMKGLFQTPFPSYIWIPWTIYFSLLTLWCILYFSTKKKSKILKIFLNLVITLAFTSLFLMFLAGLREFQFGRDEWNSIENFLKSYSK
jgi:phosphatidylserine synthase 2